MEQGRCVLCLSLPPPCHAVSLMKITSIHQAAQLVMLRGKPLDHPGGHLSVPAPQPHSMLDPLLSKVCQSQTQEGLMIPKALSSWDRSCLPTSLGMAIALSPAAGASLLWHGAGIWHLTRAASFVAMERPGEPAWSHLLQGRYHGRSSVRLSVISLSSFSSPSRCADVSPFEPNAFSYVLSHLPEPRHHQDSKFTADYHGCKTHLDESCVWGVITESGRVSLMSGLATSHLSQCAGLHHTT